MNEKHDYQALFNHSKKVRLFESIAHLLEWDQEIYMPKQGALVRAEHLELIASLSHKEQTKPQFARLLSQWINLENGEITAPCTDQQKAALREWRRDYLIAKALPNRFVREFAKLTSESIVVWTKARAENNFSLFAPYLKRIVQLSRRKAEYLGYKDHPYDALLDCYEPEMTSKQLEALFYLLKKDLSTLLTTIQNKPLPHDTFLHGTFAKERLMEFSHFLLEKMGYDFSKGRLDLSTHPFSTTLHPNDSRITTRIHTDSLFDPLSAVLHEGGHSLYEMGMDPTLYGSPLCEAVSYGIHESQSRLWETRIGQSRAFWNYFLPHLQKLFPELSSVSLDLFYAAINKVSPSFIRVEADEVTYSLHVILRFELEKKLIEGSLSIKEVPEAWNALMQQYLNIRPPTDSQGCLQDIHWAMGGFGYFPTYTLGNLYAAQFFSAFEKQFPNWEKRIEQGDLLFLREWLRENIHRFGKQYRASELVQRVTGEPLSEKHYLEYLKAKYATEID